MPCSAFCSTVQRLLKVEPKEPCEDPDCKRPAKRACLNCGEYYCDEHLMTHICPHEEGSKDSGK